jgi:hypothetical protein
MLLRGEFYENATLKGVQSVHRSTPWTMDSLYAFKCKRFCNIRHTVTFGIPL